MNQQAPKKVCLVYSGGMDSTVLLYKLREEGYDVVCLSFQYGQKHGKELFLGAHITRDLGVDHFLLHVPTMAVRMSPEEKRNQTTQLFGGSSQTDPTVPVPEGHYAEESMKKTIVPNRNMIMLSLAAAYCISNGIRDLYYAAHAGDHAIYPDCREDFILAMDEAFEQAEWPDKAVQLQAPFFAWQKVQIAAAGGELKVPFEKTWSCYVGGDLHCGRCGTCVERKEAFQLAGLTDPTSYEG